MIKTNRVLLTGSSGFVGKHVLKYLMEKTDWGIHLTETRDLLSQVPELGTFDYIIHLGSASSVEQSIASPVGFIESNVSSTLGILDYARKHKPRVFLHFSTVEVYNVTNPYAASKAAQEEIVNAYWKTYGVPAIIVRSSNIIGEGQSADKFIPKIINQINRGETVDIYTSEGKQGMRLYNPVLNVADAILFLLNRYPDYKKGKDFPTHFDIIAGEKLTNLTMAEKIAQKLGKPLHHRLIEPEEARPAYARSLATHGTKLKGLGWKPPQTLNQGLEWIK